MKELFVRLFYMMFGLLLFAVGIIITIKANIGYAPWDVFHVGVANTFGISLGLASISVGMIILAIVMFFGEKTGLGTISNIVIIGIFIDILLFIDIIKTPENFIVGVLMLIAGLFIISLGTLYYIKAGFGAGPRDSLMVLLTRKTKISVGICRSVLELLVTVIGWFLGGMVGIGTVISVFGIGFCIQITFKLLRFDVTSVKHESFYDTFIALKNIRKKTSD